MTQTEHHYEASLIGGAGDPAEQWWFWTPEWQRGEREATEQIEARELSSYNSVDDMFADLESR